MTAVRKQFGFTLLELMVAMVILFILIAIGVPSFNGLIKDSRLRTTTNKLLMDINFARSEAVKRGARVSLCRSANPVAGTPSCGGTTEVWTSGWIVFVDENLNSTFDTAGGDMILKKSEITTTGYTIIANVEGDAILAFRADGSKNNNNSARFAVCDDRNEVEGRLVTVINTGRNELKKGSVAFTNAASTCANPV